MRAIELWRVNMVRNCSNVVNVHSHDHNGKILLAHALSNYNWISLYRLDDCDSMVGYFYSIILDMLDCFMPMQASIKFSPDKPWINDRFKHLIRQRQQAWQSQDMIRYRALRNVVQRNAKNLRSKYYSRCVQSLRNAGPKQWWAGGVLSSD